MDNHIVIQIPGLKVPYSMKLSSIFSQTHDLEDLPSEYYLYPGKYNDIIDNYRHMIKKINNNEELD